MHKFATVFALVACAGQARRVMQEAAFNPSILGAHTPVGNSARVSPACIRMSHPEISNPTDIMSTITDLDGPAIAEMDLMTRKMEIKGYDQVDLFMQELEKSSLAGVLKGPGEYTLFLPVNSGVEGFLATGGTFTEEILKYHIAQGKVMKKSLEDGVTLTMLNGQTATGAPAEYGSGVEINGVPVPGFCNPAGSDAEIFPYDVACTNGLVQTIREVLTPP